MHIVIPPLYIPAPGVDEPALMSTANVFRLAQRRLSGAGSNPFEGKAFYVNPSYRRVPAVGYQSIVPDNQWIIN